MQVVEELALKRAALLKHVAVEELALMVGELALMVEELAFGCVETFDCIEAFGCVETFDCAGG